MGAFYGSVHVRTENRESVREALEAIARILELPNAVSAYEYLMRGEHDTVEGWDKFLHVPDRSEEIACQKRAEAELVAAKQRLREAGLLLQEESIQERGSSPLWRPDREGSGFLVCDGTVQRLLFGGTEGAIGFLDLSSGRSGNLLDPPGRPMIHQLGLSRDGTNLCCSGQPLPLEEWEPRVSPVLQVWNYAALQNC